MDFIGLYAIFFGIILIFWIRFIIRMYQKMKK